MARGRSGDPETANPAEAVLSLAGSARSDCLLVWHVGLLRLVPFARPRRTALFLHGVEAWKTHAGLTSHLLRKIDVCLTNSTYTWDRFVELNPSMAGLEHRVVHLGLGVPYGDAPPMPDEQPSAVMVSRLAESESYKGHREVIDCWPKVLARLPEAQLRIVGEGDLRGSLESLVRVKGLGAHVSFVGSVSDEEKEELILQSRALLMPSSGEGFGLVYVEAMRVGRPCLVSDRDAGAEVVEAAGLTVDPSDAGALALAIVDLLTLDDRWKKRSQDAAARYVDHLTAAHFRSRLQRALQQ